MSAQSEGAAGGAGAPSGVPSNAPRPGEILAAKYRVEHILGVGGMGVVVAARHLQLGQSVAVKLLATNPAPQPDALARFLREAQAAAALQSDHVVRIYDVGTLEDGSPFMVMELLRGDDLAQLIENGGPQPMGVAVEFVLQACSAISEAHARGIVHRDLKPSNLFVTTRSDGTPCIKVLDFGISKSLHADGTAGFGGNLTSTRTVLGSPYYMSPEQVRDAKNVDERADVWALGVILYELLAGRPPFDGDTLPAVCAAIAADPPKPLLPVRTDLPYELESIIFRCLEKNPERRFRSVGEFAEALSPFGGRDRASMAMVRRLTPLSPRSGSPDIGVGPTMVQSDTDRTMVSAGSDPRPHTGISVQEKTIRRRKPVLLVGFAALGLAVTALALVLNKGEAESIAPDASAATATATAAPSDTRRETFRLHIESIPEGATVIEDGARLGPTPLDLDIPRSTVRERNRTFVLEKQGYLPFSVSQGDSQDNVRISAALVTAPQGPAATTKTAAPIQRARAPKRSPEPSSKPPPSDPDIRMQR